MASWRRGVGALVLMVACRAASASAPPDFDALAQSTRRLPLVVPASPVTRQLLEHARISSVDERLGVPTFVWAGREPRSANLRAAGVTPEESARRVLLSWAEVYRAAGPALAEAALVRLHDRGEGAVIASFERRVDGVPVFRDRLHVVLDQRLQLVALSGALSPAAPGPGLWRLTPSTAAEVALADLAPGQRAGGPLREVGRDDSGALLLSAWAAEGPHRLVRPARARKVYFALERELVPAWHVELEVGAADSTDAGSFAYVVSAHDGALLFRRNLTDADAFTYRAWADPITGFPEDGPQGLGGSPHPAATPNGFSPAWVAPRLVTLQSGPISTLDPWLPAGATETTGNNVEAYADLAAPDGFGAGDLHAGVTAPGVFDRAFDPTIEPDASPAQQQAAITQLFYTVNFLHDWFYDSGFDEAAGNAQADNLGRGGVGGDSLKAEAQDVGGFNNANMSTPSDGARPRMQMYLWRPAAAGTVTAAPLGATWNSGVASFGPTSFTLTAPAAVTTPANGCTAITSPVAGQIAVIDRGTCTFLQKVENAQAAGAVGVVIVNNAAGGPPSLPGTSSTVTIGALSLSQADGTALKNAIASGPVTATLSRPYVPTRDGTVDNTIVAHEWGHYLSNRLISNSSGLSNTQGRGMGEGWSDFVALLLQVREDDAQVAANANFGGTYAVAAYSLSGPGFADASYFGIRRYPYSVDFTKNALTFRHIANGEALPTGVPSAPGGGGNAEVHNTGEVWASMLWECYVGLLRASPRLSFTQARDRMRAYLVESLSMTPPSPTFVEARDAVLAAAAARDPADLQVFVQAFARRGLGLGAVAPPRTSTSNSPVVEDFSLGNDLAFVRAELDDEAFYCDRDGTLDSGERGRLRVTLKNSGFWALSATTGTISSTTPGVTLTGASLSFPASQPFGVTTAEAEVTLAGAAAVTPIDFELTFVDPQLSSPTPRTVTLHFRGNADEVAATSAGDDAEASLVAWTATRSAGLGPTADWRRRALTGTSHVFYGPNPGTTGETSFTSPPLQVAATGTFSFTFAHRFSFEPSTTTNFDGAVIELSQDNGQSWTDIGALATPGYNGTLGGSGSTNPLLGRQAFVQASPGYPAFVPVTVNLGTTYSGQTVLVRFRIGADQSAADVGWEVDDLVFTGLTNTPFPGVVADRGLCINRPPVADAGPDFPADERSTVTLDASRSTDVDGDALTPTWTQRSGPAVSLTGGTFTAPEVAADTPVTFSLVVNDGTVDSANTDEVTVTIRQVNRAPTADAGPALQVDERSVVTLRGAGADDDGDAISFQWRQRSGPSVGLAATGAADVSFTAPDVAADTPLVFELVTSDGALSSAPSTAIVTVRQVNQRPVANPVADARVAEGQQVTLLSVSRDPDADALTHAWTQVEGPAVTLSSATAASVTFTAPQVAADTLRRFQVIASDGALESAPGVVSVVVVDGNLPPTASAGPSREVGPGDAVVLDGADSRDPEAEPLRFAWQQVEGPAVTLAAPQASSTGFTAPQVDAPTALRFRLVVTDPKGLSGQSSVTITVKPPAALGCGCTGGAGGLELWAVGLAAAAWLRRRRRG